MKNNETNKMVGIIVYGSLLNSAELADHDLSTEHVVPVKVRGYKRLFNQKPSWRIGTGDHIGVLNVECASEAWINAICLYIPYEEQNVFASRESGYIREEIHINAITCYSGFCMIEDVSYYIYRGKEEKLGKNILPNHEYLDICIQGAEEWGEDFMREFFTTTHLACGTILPEYIRTHRNDLKKHL